MIVPVDDAHDARLDDYALLKNQAARREREGDEYFIAEGYVSIDRVIDSGHRLRSIVVTPSRVERLLDGRPEIEKRDIPVFVVDRALLADTVGFDLHRGVVASADRRPVPTVADIASSDARRVAVLVGLNDAENVGVIARAARALQLDAIILDPTCTDAYSRRTVRVSMGEVLHLPVSRATNWPDDLHVLHSAGFETWAMTPAEDANNLWALTSRGLPERLAVVLGAEGPGLDALTMIAATHRVQIPIHPDVDSLNVGHAAAITFAAVCRSNAT
ncbi:MAG: RNA methyltransferase [Ilumatobacter sp.]|nr:RNA methyltransferase [Ilumatobacter sp.]